MPQITIDNLFKKEISFSPGERVLTAIQNNYIDWMFACGAKGRCTTCKMIVLSGRDNLSQRSPFEQKCLERRLLKEDERLACQCTARGDLVIRVPPENKLPHMDYSD